MYIYVCVCSVSGIFPHMWVISPRFAQRLPNAARIGTWDTKATVAWRCGGSAGMERIPSSTFFDIHIFIYHDKAISSHLFHMCIYNYIYTFVQI